MIIVFRANEMPEDCAMIGKEYSEPRGASNGGWRYAWGMLRCGGFRRGSGGGCYSYTTKVSPA